jgi:hypothetical protein
MPRCLPDMGRPVRFATDIAQFADASRINVIVPPLCEAVRACALLFNQTDVVLFRRGTGGTPTVGEMVSRSIAFIAPNCLTGGRRYFRAICLRHLFQI